MKYSLNPMLQSAARQLSLPMGSLLPPCSSFGLMDRKYKKLLLFLGKKIYNKAATIWKL